MKILLLFGVIAFLGFSKFFFQKHLLKYFDSHYMGDFIIQNKSQFREAIPKYESAIKKNPNREESFFGLAFCCEMLGDQKKAKEFYLKSFELDFDSIDTNTALILIYTDEGEFQKALHHIKTVEKLSKNQDIYEDLKEIIIESLGWISFKKKKYTEALKYYDIAIPLFEKSWSELKDEFDSLYIHIHFHFGMIYEFKKDWKNATNEFNKAIIAGGEQCIYAKKSKDELEKIALMQKKQNLF